VLVNLQRGQPQGHVVLQLGGESLLHDVVAALHVEVLESHGVFAQELQRVGGHEGDAEEAAKVVRARTRSDLRGKSVSLDPVPCVSVMALKGYLTTASRSLGSRMVSLFRRKLLMCSTTSAKCTVDLKPSLACRESMTSCTVVEPSYLKLFVWPFSRKTFNTLGISGKTESRPSAADPAVCR